MNDCRFIDPLGREFELSDHTWYEHIPSGHPEVSKHKDLVEAALTEPIKIIHSQSHDDRRIYYGRGPRPKVMMAVVADLSNGKVVTAYLVKKFVKGVEEWSSLTP